MKTTLLKKTILLAVFCLSSAMGEDLIFTRGMFNGRGWINLDPVGKTLIVTGLVDGMIIGEAKYISDLVPGSMTVTETVGVLDQFYAQPANRPVPIGCALRWVTSVARGDTPAQLERTAALLRKDASEPSK
jgi:hypothetical protein